ncbi:hypothetical protein [uncultured Clostridium sp.]|uniref:hypothetical protein n=1 Tax=uncultured Clostridium sp. TaxID=59620 RepID=UPI0026733EF0|nr:hypothetical protein [uncultured Clostridium sp.]
MKIRLCYRLEKEIGMVEDKQGNPLECYVCCQVDVKKDPVPRKQYKELVDAFRKLIAKQNAFDENYITPITLNDYLNHTEE